MQPTESPTAPGARARISAGADPSPTALTICHQPPGNPQNQRSISVGRLTAGDHLAHGDLVGPCPWTTPVHLGSVSSAATELEVTISRDGRSLYMASNRSGNFDIWVSQRASTRDPWGEPQSIGPAINTAAREQGPYLSRDGRELYFFSDRPGSDGLDIWVSRRTNPNDDFAWEAPVRLGSGVNSAANETLPVLFEDVRTGVTTLYFSANPIPPGDIYASTRQPDGTFGPRVVVAELSSARRDRVLSIRGDGLEIFLASDRPGPAATPFDLWAATRTTTSDPWSLPVNLGPIVNGAADEGGAAISFDGTTLYFTSDREGSLGGHDIWVTTRPKPRNPD